MKIIYNLALLFIFQCFSSCDQTVKLPQSASLTDSQQVKKSNTTAEANIVFRSTDGGQTWQDISEGLPKPVKGDSVVSRNVSFADDNGLYLISGNWLYHTTSNNTTSFWTKEIFPDEHSSISPAKAGLFAYNYLGGGISQKTNGSNVWSPVFKNFHEKGIRTVLETSGGALYIGADSGLFRSLDNGKTWKNVHGRGFVLKSIESNGVIMAGVDRNVIQSTDNGEHWELVTNEGGVAYDVEPIEGGVVAFTFNSKTKMRRIITSYDGGKTWQSIDTSVPENFNMFSFIRLGENLYGSHLSGIFKSSDEGKTWKLLLPSIGDKIFNLYVSGNVIYALARNKGC